VCNVVVEVIGRDETRSVHPILPCTCTSSDQHTMLISYTSKSVAVGIIVHTIPQQVVPLYGTETTNDFHLLSKNRRVVVVSYPSKLLRYITIKLKEESVVVLTVYQIDLLL